ncbi:MAG: aminopeptidase P family protein [Actinobacteria bacterium]|nr:aminopeptidase P family protein [Actinomycetota bacterium]
MDIADFDGAEYARRVEKIRGALADAGLEAMLIVDEPNYRYVTGHHTEAWKVPFARRVCWVLRDRDPVILVPPGEGRDASEYSPWSDVREHDGFVWGPLEIAGAKLVEYEDSLVELLVESGEELGLSGAGSLGMPMRGWTIPDLQFGVVRAAGERLGIEWVDVTALLWKARLIKSDAEIAQMRAAVGALDAAFAGTFESVRVGTTEKEISRMTKANILLGGAEEVAFTFADADVSDDRAIGAAPRETRVKDGAIVLLDAGAVVHGYRSDYNRLAIVGEPSSAQAEAYGQLFEAHTAGLEAVRPGATAGDVAMAIRESLAASGVEVAPLGPNPPEELGHGIGVELPEPPFLVPGSSFELEQGMILTIEPNAFFPGVGRLVLEDDIVVTAGGAEQLSTKPTPAQLIRL